jgi:hypothetical protein
MAPMGIRQIICPTRRRAFGFLRKRNIDIQKVTGGLFAGAEKAEKMGHCNEASASMSHAD